jgi:hypothetical protein
MSAGFVLVQTEARAVGAVHALLAADGRVDRVDPVTGPYDLIAAVHSDAAGLVALLGGSDGVTRTLTCPSPSR